MSEGKQTIPWYNSVWTHRREVSINHKKVAEDLKNFWVCLTREPLIEVQGLFETSLPDNGMFEAIRKGDILFTAEDGVTKLNHRYENENEEWVWVEIPELSTTRDTKFFCYYKAVGEEV